MNAQHMSTKKSLQRHIKQLNKDFANIMAQPFFEDVNQKVSILLAAYGAIGNEIAGLRIKNALFAGLLAPALIRDIQRIVAGSFNDRNKLNPLGTQFITEKTINIPAVPFIGSINCTENIKIDIVLFKITPATHYQIKCSFPAAIAAVGIM